MGRVVVFLQNEDNGHVFDGQYEAGVTPGNCLLITEMIPDVANKNGGNPVPQIRTIYNPDVWAQVGVTDEVDTDTVGD